LYHGSIIGIWASFKDFSCTSLFFILWVVWDNLLANYFGQLIIVLTTNRIKMRASLVPVIVVIPAHQVFFIFVVVKKFLALGKFSFFNILDMEL